MANKGRLTTGIFCLFLAGLLVWHIALPDRARSETENRTLAQFPDFSWETLKNEIGRASCRERVFRAV